METYTTVQVPYTMDNKQIEIDTLYAIASVMPENSYLASLFTADFCSIVKSHILNDHEPNLAAHLIDAYRDGERYKHKAETFERQRNQYKAERDRLSLDLAEERVETTRQRKEIEQLKSSLEATKHAYTLMQIFFRYEETRSKDLHSKWINSVDHANQLENDLAEARQEILRLKAYMFDHGLADEQ